MACSTQLLGSLAACAGIAAAGKDFVDLQLSAASDCKLDKYNAILFEAENNECTHLNFKKHSKHKPNPSNQATPYHSLSFRPHHGVNMDTDWNCTVRAFPRKDCEGEPLEFPVTGSANFTMCHAMPNDGFWSAKVVCEKRPYVKPSKTTSTSADQTITHVHIEGPLGTTVPTVTIVETTEAQPSVTVQNTVTAITEAYVYTVTDYTTTLVTDAPRMHIRDVTAKSAIPRSISTSITAAADITQEDAEAALDDLYGSFAEWVEEVGASMSA